MTDEKTTPGQEPPKTQAANETIAPAAAAPPKPVVPAGPKKWAPTGEVVENALSAAVKAAFVDAVQGVPNTASESTVLVKRENLIEVLTFLRDDPSCLANYLSDMTAAHYPNNDKKFEVMYHCYSLEKGLGLRVKVQLADGESSPSAVCVWPGADWMEREAHDMFGVVFEGHPNPKVILLPDNFEGHPLRKEFPLGGAQEEMIRGNLYGKPAYMSDNIEDAKKIIQERRHGS